MAEVRKHNPDAGDGLGKLVRDALGESIRPHEAGSRQGAEGESSQTPETEQAEATASSLPIWPSDGPAYTF
ncbi:MAG: hypothetical protein Q4P15_09980 [Propionibacteriaceae bacterium]|nr:hypothetical protein [Propionibacteriaceae bacterium]